MRCVHFSYLGDDGGEFLEGFNAWCWRRFLACLGENCDELSEFCLRSRSYGTDTRHDVCVKSGA